MANEHYDEFCLASYPDLTQLERQLLGHYCTRFNESVVPPRAWPPLRELVNITGAHPKSVSRALGNLTRKGYLRRITLASLERGRKAEYAPNRELIRSRIKVTGELPNIHNITHLQVTGEDTSSNTATQLSNPPVAFNPPDSYPKPNQPNQPNNVDIFNSIILNSLPERLRSVSPNSYLSKLLGECESIGILDDVRCMLTDNRWDNVKENPGGIVVSLIKKAIERKRQGLPVVTRKEVTPSPPPFVDEVRELTPMSQETKELWEETKRKLNRFGSIPS